MTGMVDSLVKDIIMPPIGLFIGGVDFSQIFITIGPGKDGTFFYNTVAAAQAAGATTLNIGMFLNAFISFMITMFAVFLLVRVVNKARGQKPDKTRVCPYCKTSIDRMATKCPNCCSDVVPLLPEKPVDSCEKSSKRLVCRIKKIIK
jgi:large conductance mechanosensitive channel